MGDNFELEFNNAAEQFIALHKANELTPEMVDYLADVFADILKRRNS